jgi:putative DNA primase/helicase
MMAEAEEFSPEIEEMLDKGERPDGSRVESPKPGELLLTLAPVDNAKAFAKRECARDGTPMVWWWADGFWRWNGQYYVVWDKVTIRKHVYRFLDGAYRRDGDGGKVRFRPKKSHVDDLIDALKSLLALDPDCIPPMWLLDKEPVPAHDWTVFRNRVVNIRTGEKVALTHRLWAISGLEYDWDPEAKCEVWDRFLNDVFGNDKQSKDTLEEGMGLSMTGDVRFDKGVMLIGKGRGGKSTIVELLGPLGGEGAYAGLSLNDWLASAKSTEVLIAKRVIAFSDVRLKPGKWYGSSYDPGGIDHKSTELLLKITGGDKVSIPRLYAVNWNGVLPAKVWITSNEVPNFNDPTGVLPTRFIKLHFRVSFAGREDIHMKDKLVAELPGIAQRCVKAYQRLCERGKFVQPKSSADLERAVLTAADAFKGMVYECFESDYSGEVCLTGPAVDRFESWCKENGRLDVLRSVGRNRFWTRLSEVPGFEHITEFREHGQPRGRLGVRLRGSVDEITSREAETEASVLDEAPTRETAVVIPLAPARR